MKFSRVLFCLLLISVILCASCKKSNSGDDSADGDGGGGSSNSQYAVFAVSGTSTDKGLARIDFNIPDNASKFSLTITIPQGFARVDSVTDSSGNEFVAPSGAFLSLAQIFSSSESFVSVPSRDFDARVKGPDSFTAVLTTASNALGTKRASAPLTLTITTSTDPDLSSGNLVMNIFYVGDAGQTAQVKAAAQAALAQVKDIYGQVGISVTVVERDIAGPSVLSDPSSGSDFYLSASSAAGGPASYQFIAGDVDTSIDEDVFGITGAIPGSPNPTRFSAVAISANVAAGPDGAFSDIETRTLAETIAHETGHYLGLFHPVEISDVSGVEGEDPLPDTPTCSSLNDCLSDDNLIHNLMFPFPVRDNGGTFVRQNQLTNQQGGVMNHHVAVD